MNILEMTYAEWKRQQYEWTGGLRRGTREWRAAWKGLIRLSGDADKEAECPRTGEAWSYMGSFFVRGGWVHEFWHRNHRQSR